MTPHRLRAWQEKAFERWSRNARGIVDVTTGAGKTVFALHCIRHFRQANTRARVFIVVPTLALLDQWYITLMEALNVAEDDIGLFHGGGRTQPRNLNLLILNTARSILPQLRRQGDMLVVDECHRAGSPVNALALQGEYSATLGLSATPERDYDDGFERYLVPALGPVVFTYSTHDAVTDGVLVPFDLINIRIPLSAEEQAEYDRLSAALAKLDKDDNEHLKRLLQKRASVAAQARARVPVAIRLVLQARSRRAVVFHERISEAEKIAQGLTRRGMECTLYHSDIPENIRRHNLQMFRRRVYPVLVTCRALDEGLDVPDLEVGIIASATASRRQRVQRLGRVLRTTSEKQRASVYTLYASDAEEKHLAREAALAAEEVNVSWASVAGG